MISGAKYLHTQAEYASTLNIEKDTFSQAAIEKITEVSGINSTHYTIRQREDTYGERK